jgi:hypothetical protein
MLQRLLAVALSACLTAGAAPVGSTSSGAPSGGDAAPTLGPLRVDGTARWFAAGATRVDYRELSAFSLYSRWLLGQQSHVNTWSARARTHDVSALRVLLTLGGPYWESQPAAWFGHGLSSGPHLPGFYEQLVPFVRAMAAQGLRVRLVLLGDLHMFVPPERHGDLAARRDALDEATRERIRAYVRRVVTTLAGEPTVIWEVANEYGNIGMSESEAFVAELGALVKSLDPDALINFSASLDQRTAPTQWLRAPADFVSAHVDRDRGLDGYAWLRGLERAPALVAAHQPRRMPYLSGEPLNFGDDRRDGRTGDVEPSAAVAFAYGAASRVLQFNTTFHHDDGLWTSGWGERTDRAMAAWRQGLDAIPMLDGSPRAAGDDASPWRPEVVPPRTGDEAAVAQHVEAGRGPTALFGNGAYSVVVGVKTGWQYDAALRAGRGGRVVARVADGTRETLVVTETP